MLDLPSSSPYLAKKLLGVSMKLSRIFIYLLFIIMLGSSLSIKADTLINTNAHIVITTSQAEPAAALNKDILDGIKLLENKEYEKFLKRYPLPEEFEKILQEVTFEQLTAAFAGENAEQLLKALKICSTIAPAFNEDKTEARFKVNLEGAGEYLVFKRVNNIWYVRN